jgi:aldose sugar dehydrogenase
MAIHPDFARNPYVYVDYTKRKDSTHFVCKLVRFTYNGKQLISPKTLLEIPASTGHNGSRLLVTRDRKLLFATGDAASLSNAQDYNSLNGKVLRINLDGSVPNDNPINGSLVWSLGHRNIQGLALGPSGILYASEHGDAVEDEVNIIQKGANYGWIKVEGFCDQPTEKAFCDSVKVTQPIKAWTPTIAPAGITCYNHPAIPEWRNSILLTTLKESDLRILKLDRTGRKITDESIFFDQQFGRLRAICQAPSGDIYISTSNRDWNPGKGFPKKTDDLILRIRSAADGKPLETFSQNSILTKTNEGLNDSGKKTYRLYCASCHKEDGQGVAHTFPPLKNASQVTGSKTALLKIVLNGLKGEIEVDGQKYDQHMPAFGFLKNEDLTNVVNYVRTQFGKLEDPVTSEDVSEARRNP